MRPAEPQPECRGDYRHRLRLGLFLRCRSMKHFSPCVLVNNEPLFRLHALAASKKHPGRVCVTLLHHQELAAPPLVTFHRGSSWGTRAARSQSDNAAATCFLSTCSAYSATVCCPQEEHTAFPTPFALSHAQTVTLLALSFTYLRLATTLS